MRHALVLAGGAGTRFWPRSRKDRPKQVLHIVGHKSLIQDTMARIEDAVPSERVHIITSDMQYAAIEGQVGSGPRAILEPFGRDTAASIGLGAEIIAKADPDAVIATFPADHHIQPEAKFRRALEVAYQRVEGEGGLLLFGIPPRGPSTSYGYIHRGEEVASGLYRVKAFKEKPDLTTAGGYVEGREHYWNSGMFVWRANEILASIREHHAELGGALDKIREALGTPNEERAIREAFTSLQRISIDYAVLEKASNIFVQEATFEWDDVGTWTALERLHRKDDHGNVAVGRHVALESKGLIVYGGERLIATIGIEDLIIVESRDAILVAHKSRAEDVKALVKKIEEGGLEAYL